MLFLAGGSAAVGNDSRMLFLSALSARLGCATWRLTIAGGIQPGWRLRLLPDREELLISIGFVLRFCAYRTHSSTDTSSLKQNTIIRREASSYEPENTIDPVTRIEGQTLICEIEMAPFRLRASAPWRGMEDETLSMSMDDATYLWRRTTTHALVRAESAGIDVPLTATSVTSFRLRTP